MVPHNRQYKPSSILRHGSIYEYAQSLNISISATNTAIHCKCKMQAIIGSVFQGKEGVLYSGKYGKFGHKFLHLVLIM